MLYFCLLCATTRQRVRRTTILLLALFIFPVAAFTQNAVPTTSPEANQSSGQALDAVTYYGHRVEGLPGTLVGFWRCSRNCILGEGRDGENKESKQKNGRAPDSLSGRCAQETKIKHIKFLKRRLRKRMNSE